MKNLLKALLVLSCCQTSFANTLTAKSKIKAIDRAKMHAVEFAQGVLNAETPSQKLEAIVSRLEYAIAKGEGAIESGVINEDGKVYKLSEKQVEFLARKSIESQKFLIELNQVGPEMTSLELDELALAMSDESMQASYDHGAEIGFLMFGTVFLLVMIAAAAFA